MTDAQTPTQEPKKKHAGGAPKVPLTERLARYEAQIKEKVTIPDDPEQEPILHDYDYILRLAAAGLTDAQIAVVMGVSERQIYNWKQTEEFASCLKNNGALANKAVERSLFARAMGYSHPAVKIMQYEGQVITEDYTEHYPPDTAACFGWLYNREPDRWKRMMSLDGFDPTKGIDLRLELVGVRPKNGNGTAHITTGDNGNGNGTSIDDH
jgi:hypothetical protein